MKRCSWFVVLGSLFVLLAGLLQAAELGSVALLRQSSGDGFNEGTACRLVDHPDGRSTWLTAGHNVQLGPVTVDGLAGECVQRSDDPDLAIILATPCQGDDCFVLVDDVPATASAFGFGVSRGHYRRVQISRRVVRYKTHTAEQLSGECLSDFGDSGGPLYENNQLYGIQCGADQPGQVAGAHWTPTSQVKRWVEKVGYQYCYQWQWSPGCAGGRCSPPPPTIHPAPGAKIPAAPSVDVGQLESRIQCLEAASRAQSQGLRDLAELRSRVEVVEAQSIDPERLSQLIAATKSNQDAIAALGGKVETAAKSVEAIQKAKHRVIVARGPKVIDAREYGLTDDVILDPSLFTVK